MIQVWYWCKVAECMRGIQLGSPGEFWDWYNTHAKYVRTVRVEGMDE